MNSKLRTVLRLILAIVLLVFGTNKFFNFLPMPPMEGMAGEFMGTLFKSGYFFPFLGFIETLVGLLLIFNKWKRFALVMLVPVSVNIVLFHLFLAPAGIGPAALVAVLNGVLIYANWNHYKSLF